MGKPLGSLSEVIWRMWPKTAARQFDERAALRPASDQPAGERTAPAEHDQQVQPVNRCQPVGIHVHPGQVQLTRSASIPPTCSSR